MKAGQSLRDWKALSAGCLSALRGGSEVYARRLLSRMAKTGSAERAGPILPWSREVFYGWAGFPRRLLPHAALVADAARRLAGLIPEARTIPESVLRGPEPEPCGRGPSPSSWRVPDILLVHPCGSLRIEIQRTRKPRDYFLRESATPDGFATLVLVPPGETTDWYHGVRCACVLDEEGMREEVRAFLN